MFSFYLSYDNYIIIVTYNQVKKHREENKKSPCKKGLGYSYIVND